MSAEEILTESSKSPAWLRGASSEADANVRFTYELPGAVKEILVIEKESQNITEGLVMVWPEKEDV